MTAESQDVGQMAANESATQDQGGTAARRAEFQAIFKAESSFVWNTLLRFGVGRRDLEDLVADVFMTFYKRLDDYDRSRPIRPWLFGIAYRVALRYHELARHHHEIMTDVPDARDETPGADEQLIAGETRDLLSQALDALPLDRRAVFVMHDVEECAMPDIAAALAIPLNTAYSRLRLAREELRSTVRRLRARRGET